MHDIKSNIGFATAAGATSYNVNTYNASAVDTAPHNSLTFILNIGAVGSSATVDFKLQWSADGSTGWTDEDGSTGNGYVRTDGSITGNIPQATATGSYALHVVRPQARYYRPVTTVGTAACSLFVGYMYDPKDKPPARLT